MYRFAFKTVLLVSFALVGMAECSAYQDFYQAANERIEQHRKTDIDISVVDSNGRAVVGADVEVNMTRHAFRWGTAVVGYRINSSTVDNQVYKQKLLENFNSVVLENDLKWPPWTGAWSNNFGWNQAEPALDWLDANNLPTRGHYVAWGTLSGAEGYGPNNENVNSIPAALLEHIDDKLSTVGDRITEWDVINHPIGWGPSTYGDEFGDEFYSMIINASRAAASPGAEMWMNEDNILNGGSVADRYEALLNFLINDSAAPDGIGIQGHFKSSWGRNQPGSDQQIYTQLERFSQIIPRIQLTEFDIDVGVYDSDNNLVSYDQQLHAELMNNYLISMFSHEDLEGITMWGFWEGAHWLPSAALYDQDWTPRPALVAYQNLVFNEWWTDESGQSGLDGKYELRGFKGDYDVQVTSGGQTYSTTAQFNDQNGSLTIVVEAPFLLGDVNQDDQVNFLDISPFIEVLSSGIYQSEADVNGDGVVNFEDIAPFITALSSSN